MFFTRIRINSLKTDLSFTSKLNGSYAVLFYLAFSEEGSSQIPIDEERRFRTEVEERSALLRPSL